MPDTVTKADLRKHAKNIRAACSLKHSTNAAEKACDHVLRFFANEPKNTVFALYSPINSELDCRFLAQALDNRGYTIALPVMTMKNAPLAFRQWAPGDPLVDGILQIPEPTPDAPTVHPDVILCPCLGFDEDGYRLGYGGGYYDRTLRQDPSVSAFGYAYSEQFLDTIPRDNTDMPMQGIFTPDGLVLPKGKPLNKAPNKENRK